MPRAYGYGSRNYNFKGFDREALERLRKEARISGLPVRAVNPDGKISLPTEFLGLDEDGTPQFEFEAKNKFFRPKGPDVTIDIDGNEVVDYRVDFDTVEADSATPARLTVVPTTSTNASKPYTVAAGWARYPQQSVAYESSLGTLTCLFRDGTLWNYYNVEYSFWIRFSGSISKGQYINVNSKNAELTKNYQNGPADISGVDQRTLNLMYTTARRIQLNSASKRAYTYTNASTGEKRRAEAGTVVPKRAQKSLGKPPKPRTPSKKR